MFSYRRFTSRTRTPLPTLSREEARVLAGLRRLLVARVDTFPTPEPDALTLILKELKLMSDTFETAMSKLSADVAAQNTVIASATQAFRGLVGQLVAAEAAAKNAGATDAQVASVTSVREQLEANTASLAAAIPANTEAASGTTAPVTSAPTPTSTPVSAPASDPATTSAAAIAPAPADMSAATTTDAAAAKPAA